MRKILILVFNIICIFLLSICVFAEGEIEIYNRGEKVELNHDLVYENEQYYIHIDDLSLLGLNVSEENDLLKKTSNLKNTKFYTYLNSPESNALQYDIERLFDIYQQEIELGKIVFLFDNKKI